MPHGIPLPFNNKQVLKGVNYYSILNKKAEFSLCLFHTTNSKHNVSLA
jgi:hypothetical protein